MKPCAMARAVSFVFLALGVVVMVAADSVIDELEKNGLPVGLLPSSVQSYSIGAKGDFSVSLEAPCYAKIEDQVLGDDDFIAVGLGWDGMVSMVVMVVMEV